MNIDFPFDFDARGRTAACGDDEHVRDMIEQVIFTEAGERVNRPDFGSGAMQLLFAPLHEGLAEAVKFTLRGALERWLGDVIDVQDLQAAIEDATLLVTITYHVRRTGAVRQDTFDRTVPA